MLCSVYSVFIGPTGNLRLTWLRFFCAFSSVVRQMPGYNSQRWGTTTTLPNKLIVCVDCVVLCIVCVCKCVLYYCQQVSTQLQLTDISSSLSFTTVYWYWLQFILQHCQYPKLYNQVAGCLMNWKGSGKWQLWPNWLSYPDNWLERLKKVTKISELQSFELGSSWIQDQSITTTPHCFVFSTNISSAQCSQYSEWAMDWLDLMHAHTHARTHTHSRTPLNEWSACRRGHFLHNKQ
jgi:hypothetical protein